MTVHERRAFIDKYIEIIIVHPKVPTWNKKMTKMTLSKTFDPT